MSTVNPNSLVRKRFGRTAIATSSSAPAGFMAPTAKVTLSKPCSAGAEREIRVVADQIGSPTWTGDIASAIAGLIPQLSQTRAVPTITRTAASPAGTTAVAIFEEARHLGFPSKSNVSFHYYRRLSHPPTSRLFRALCAKISAILEILSWRQALRQMLAELVDTYEALILSGGKAPVCARSLTPG